MIEDTIETQTTGPLKPEKHTVGVCQPSRASEYSEYDRELKLLQDAQRYKLWVNRHKGKWEGLSQQRLLELLRGEVEELAQAVEANNQVEAILEAGDVSNYALMLVAVAFEIGAGKSRG
jgi:hypothetical protein